MPVNLMPHSSWAEAYDLAYDRSFGEFYERLTFATTRVIAERVRAGGRIVDFGSGTGRLAIPLADKGFEITAVDPCPEMLCQLEKKRQNAMNLRTVCSTMQDFKESDFDFAICVFTVLLYLLDEESLEKAISAAYRTLKPGGFLMIDIPSKALFGKFSKKDHLIERSVSVIEEKGGIYLYREELKVHTSGSNPREYSDEFKIRYWEPDYVLKTLLRNGFSAESDLTDQFSATGSHYWIMKKPDNDSQPCMAATRQSTR